MNKFSFLIFILLFSVFICLGAGSALGASGLIDSSALQVNLTNQNPDPAHPGEPAELTISLQNIGDNNLKDITVSVKPKSGSSSMYPFSQISGEPLEQSIPYLNARQDSSDAAVLKFKLMTDLNAAEGTYDIDVITTATEDGSTSNTITTTRTIHVNVRGKEYAQIVTINKANIDVGKEEPLEFIVTNTGSSPLKNMVISWKDPKGVILPIYSDNTKYIKSLETNQSVTIDYSVMADVNAAPGLYTLDVNLTFENYDSQTQSIQTSAGLFVGGPTDFDVSYSESSQGQTSLSVANVGNNMAYAVKVSIPDQDAYRVDGSSSTIVGNLEKGDYTIASFNITSTQDSVGQNSVPKDSIASSARDNSTDASINENPLKVQIEYTDAKGERLTVDKDVAIPSSVFGIRNFSEQRGYRNKSSGLYSSLPYIVLIVVVAGIGAFLYRKRKQSIKNQKVKHPQQTPTND
jgi:hypothetical protein